MQFLDGLIKKVLIIKRETIILRRGYTLSNIQLSSKILFKCAFWTCVLAWLSTHCKIICGLVPSFCLNSVQVEKNKMKENYWMKI